MIRSLAWPASLLLAALSFVPTHLHAQALDLSGGGPIEVTAAGGMEWHETEQMVIATGDARAVRDNVTVLADRLVARYRKKGAALPPIRSSVPATQAPATQAPATQAAADGDTGGNEVYRLEAHGHVRIITETDEAVGDDAIYDIDQAVLVMTGRALKLTTPQQILTARDTMEYWSQKHMAVGRGNAVVVTADARRLSGDVLVAFTSEGNPAAPKPVSAKPGAKDDPLNAAGKLERVEAYGNVEVRTIIDIVRGDRGIYLPDTGIARLVGRVRITHEGNQVNGPAADINMKTGIARLASAPGNRVQGLIVPNSTDAARKPDPAKAGPAQAGPAQAGLTKTAP